MSIGDTLDYITLSNPVSKMVISSTSSVLRAIGLRPKHAPVKEIATAIQPQVIMYQTFYEMAGRNYNFVRLAGLGGATAIFMGAYCKYYLKDIDNPKEQLESQSFADLANRIHFLHSFALMAMPLAHHPKMTGFLMTTGTMLFSGCMYYRALTGHKNLHQYATIGGFFLIAGWMSLVF